MIEMMMHDEKDDENDNDDDDDYANLSVSVFSNRSFRCV